MTALNLIAYPLDLLVEAALLARIKPLLRTSDGLGRPGHRLPLHRLRVQCSECQNNSRLFQDCPAHVLWVTRELDVPTTSHQPQITPLCSTHHKSQTQRYAPIVAADCSLDLDEIGLNEIPTRVRRAVSTLQLSSA